MASRNDPMATAFAAAGAAASMVVFAPMWIGVMSTIVVVNTFDAALEIVTRHWWGGKQETTVNGDGDGDGDSDD